MNNPDNPNIQIYRPKNSFTIFPNETAENPNLSMKAKGVLLYLASRPPGWIPRIDDIINHCKDGRSAIYTAMRELRAAGYAKLIIIRKKGKIRAVEWHVRITLKCEFLKTDFQHQEKRHLNKTISTNPKGLVNKTHCSAGAERCDLGLSSKTNGQLIEIKFSHKFYNWAIKNGLLIGRTKPKLKVWQETIKELIAQLNGDTAKIKKVMLWYFDHFKERYVPKCYALTTFCDKFLAIEDAMKRDLGVEEFDPEVDTPKIIKVRRKLTEKDFDF